MRDAVAHDHQNREQEAEPIEPDGWVPADAHADLEWLRAENALLRIERDIRGRVAAGFARDARLDPLARTPGVDERATCGRTRRPRGTR